MVAQFLAAMPAHGRRPSEVQALFPNARIVFNRFHIMKLLVYLVRTFVDVVFMLLLFLRIQ